MRMGSVLSGLVMHSTVAPQETVELRLSVDHQSVSPTETRGTSNGLNGKTNTEEAEILHCVQQNDGFCDWQQTGQF